MITSGVEEADWKMISPLLKSHPVVLLIDHKICQMFCSNSTDHKVQLMWIGHHLVSRTPVKQLRTRVQVFRIESLPAGGICNICSCICHLFYTIPRRDKLQGLLPSAKNIGILVRCNTATFRMKEFCALSSTVCKTVLSSHSIL